MISMQPLKTFKTKDGIWKKKKEMNTHGSIKTFRIAYEFFRKNKEEHDYTIQYLKARDGEYTVTFRTQISPVLLQEKFWGRSDLVKWYCKLTRDNYCELTDSYYDDTHTRSNEKRFLDTLQKFSETFNRRFRIPERMQLDLMREFGCKTFDEYSARALKIIAASLEGTNSNVESAQTPTCVLLENLIVQTPAFHADKLRFLMAKNLHSYQMYPLAIKILEGKFLKTSPFSSEAAHLLCNCYGAIGERHESFEEKKPFLEAAFKIASGNADSEISKHYAGELFKQLCGFPMDNNPTNVSDSVGTLLLLADRLRISNSTVKEVTERNHVLSEEKQQLEGENETLQDRVSALEQSLAESNARNDELNQRLQESKEKTTSDKEANREEQINKFRLFQQRERAPKVAKMPSEDGVGRNRSNFAPSTLQNTSLQPSCTV